MRIARRGPAPSTRSKTSFGEPEDLAAQLDDERLRREDAERKLAEARAEIERPRKG